MKTIIALILFATAHLTFAQAITSSDYRWKGVFIAGDHSIKNFDRARVDLAELFSNYGVVEDSHFSRRPEFLSNPEIYAPTMNNLVLGFENLNIDKEIDACLIHMTSHGVRGQGFYLSGIGILPPEVLSQVIDSHCGDIPTVLLVSACFSGQFITESLKGDNRIILTAARHDVPSFGCSPATTYTYWDGCLLDELPNSETWSELYEGVSACVEEKESSLGFNRSFPQAFFGRNVTNLRIINK